MSQGIRQALAVDPESRRFDNTGQQALVDSLRETERNSAFRPLTSPREVLLDNNGRTLVGGSRFTHWAFFQLCQALSPGLYRLMIELSGSQRTPEQDRNDYSFEEAIQVINMLIRRRFTTKLYGRHLLRDTRTNVIHGVVGSNYRWLPNKDLYDRTVNVVAASRQEMVFHEAILNGRWLMLRFCRRDPFFSVASPAGGADVFYNGFHFSNNEVGLASVRAAAFLWRREGNTTSMTPAVRLVHSAQRGFDQRLELTLSGVADRLKEPEFYSRHVLRLRAATLRLGSRDERAERRRRDDLSHLLTRRKMNMGLARRVVIGACGYGSYDSPRAEMTRTQRSTLATRTFFDLYNSMGREARRLTIGAQEQAEQVAYALLVGGLRIE